ncbi:MAG: hypothetical protein IT376_20910 [Polyangiaceae bacterium]|nr:hypothetical protein [Polyangiaceae bacterium]
MSRRHRAGRLALALALAVGCAAVAVSAPARADDRAPAPRSLRLQWDAAKRQLRATFEFRDVMTKALRRKLKRGLPTTIVLTGALYSAGSKVPLATTAQTCKITYLVWDEVWRVEIARPGAFVVERTPTVLGVMRRCAQATRLLVATGAQVPEGMPLYLQAKVQVNPLSPAVLRKVRRWVSRPLATGTASAGDALFSTFTGLFLQRIGDAERTLEIVTKPSLPEEVRGEP